MYTYIFIYLFMLERARAFVCARFEYYCDWMSGCVLFIYLPLWILIGQWQTVQRPDHSEGSGDAAVHRSLRQHKQDWLLEPDPFATHPEVPTLRPAQTQRSAHRYQHFLSQIEFLSMENQILGKVTGTRIWGFDPHRAKHLKDRKIVSVYGLCSFKRELNLLLCCGLHFCTGISQCVKCAWTCGPRVWIRVCIGLCVCPFVCTRHNTNFICFLYVYVYPWWYTKRVYIENGRHKAMVMSRWRYLLNNNLLQFDMSRYKRKGHAYKRIKRIKQDLDKNTLKLQYINVINATREARSQACQVKTKRQQREMENMRL